MLPFIALCFSALIHLPFTVGYHLFLCMSPEVCNTWRKLDIAFIFVSACFLTFALGFFVLPAWGLGLNVCAAVVMTLYALGKISRLKKGEALDKVTHTIFIGTIVVVYAFPMAYQAISDAVDSRCTGATWSALSASVALGVGGWAYAVSFPEKHFPGRGLELAVR